LLLYVRGGAGVVGFSKWWFEGVDWCECFARSLGPLVWGSPNPPCGFVEFGSRLHPRCTGSIKAGIVGVLFDWATWMSNSCLASEGKLLVYA